MNTHIASLFFENTRRVWACPSMLLWATRSSALRACGHCDSLYSETPQIRSPVRTINFLPRTISKLYASRRHRSQNCLRVSTRASPVRRGQANLLCVVPRFAFGSRAEPHPVRAANSRECAQAKHPRRWRWQIESAYKSRSIVERSV